MRRCLVITCGLFSSGCASHLEITENKSGLAVVVPGVPFHAPELYVREGTFKTAAKGGACNPTPFLETEVLPLGPMYYANVKPAEFAKTGFSIKFNDKGTVSEITLNTEPSAGDALKSAGDLITAVSPLLGVAAAAPALGPACDTGPVGIKYTRFSEWQAAHP